MGTVRTGTEARAPASETALYEAPTLGGVQGPVASTDGGSLLRVELTPGADEDTFPAGYNPWREVVEARVSAPAREGEANRALVELVAAELDLPTGQVRIKTGPTSRRKTLTLQGLPLSTLEEKLDGVLPG